jgi:hypothetical protein
MPIPAFGQGAVIVAGCGIAAVVTCFPANDISIATNGCAVFARCVAGPTRFNGCTISATAISCIGVPIVTGFLLIKLAIAADVIGLNLTVRVTALAAVTRFVSFYVDIAIPAVGKGAIPIAERRVVAFITIFVGLHVDVSVAAFSEGAIAVALECVVCNAIAVQISLITLFLRIVITVAAVIGKAENFLTGGCTEGTVLGFECVVTLWSA